jgi:hypothetical protein
MATFLGTALWEQCRVSFGYLQSQGYCSSERCTRFPIVIGEVGSAFETASDKQWLQDFADFVNAEVRKGDWGWGGGSLYNGSVVALLQGKQLNRGIHGCCGTYLCWCKVRALGAACNQP